MWDIFNADWFYDPNLFNKKIKSPIHLTVNICQLAGSTIENFLIYYSVHDKLGQLLLNPPNVAGWPGGKSWINNGSLALRLNLGYTAFTQGQRWTLALDNNIKKIFDAFNDQGKTLQDLRNIVLQDQGSRSGSIISFKSLDNHKAYSKVLAALTSQLEFQMC